MNPTQGVRGEDEREREKERENEWMNVKSWTSGGRGDRSHVRQYTHFLFTRFNLVSLKINKRILIMEWQLLTTTTKKSCLSTAKEFLFITWLILGSWTARRSNQSILKEISLGCCLEGMMLKLKLQYFGHLMNTLITQVYYNTIWTDAKMTFRIGSHHLSEIIMWFRKLLYSSHIASGTKAHLQISQWKAVPTLCWEVYDCATFQRSICICLVHQLQPHSDSYGLGISALQLLWQFPMGGQRCALKSTSSWCWWPVQFLGAARSQMRQWGHSCPCPAPQPPCQLPSVYLLFLREMSV